MDVEKRLEELEQRVAVLEQRYPRHRQRLTPHRRRAKVSEVDIGKYAIGTVAVILTMAALAALVIALWDALSLVTWLVLLTAFGGLVQAISVTRLGTSTAWHVVYGIGSSISLFAGAFIGYGIPALAWFCAQQYVAYKQGTGWIYILALVGGTTSVGLMVWMQASYPALYVALVILTWIFVRNGEGRVQNIASALVPAIICWQLADVAAPPIFVIITRVLATFVFLRNGLESDFLEFKHGRVPAAAVVATGISWVPMITEHYPFPIMMGILVLLLLLVPNMRSSIMLGALPMSVIWEPYGALLLCLLFLALYAIQDDYARLARVAVMVVCVTIDMPIQLRAVLLCICGVYFYLTLREPSNPHYRFTELLLYGTYFGLCTDVPAIPVFTLTVACVLAVLCDKQYEPTYLYLAGVFSIKAITGSPVTAVVALAVSAALLLIISWRYKYVGMAVSTVLIPELAVALLFLKIADNALLPYSITAAVVAALLIVYGFIAYNKAMRVTGLACLLLFVLKAGVYDAFNSGSAYAVALGLAVAALICLGVSIAYHYLSKKFPLT